MKIVSMECPKCGAPLKVDRRRSRAVCEHCESSFYLDQGSRLLDEGSAQERQAEEERLAAARSGSGGNGTKKKRRTWLWVLGWIFFTAIPLTILIARSRRLPKVVKGLLIGLVWLAWAGLMFHERIKEETATYDWNEIILHEYLPQPASKAGELSYNNANAFHLYVRKTSPSEFAAYQKACQEWGYTVDVKDSSNLDAFNEEGYHVQLWYMDYDKEMSISLEAPRQLGVLHWPTSELGKLLPTPKSQVGTVAWESNTGFSIYVGETTIEEYGDYVDECRDCGFSENYYRGDRYFHAETAGGVRVSVNYEGFGVMYISATAPDEDSVTAQPPERAEAPESESEEITESEPVTDAGETEETTGEAPERATSETEAEPVPEGEIREEFKKAMDDYEAFIDEYCKFIGEYFDSDSPAEKLPAYMDYLTKFLDQSVKAEQWSEKALNDAEMKYYTEVMMRCAEKASKVNDRMSGD